MIETIAIIFLSLQLFIYIVADSIFSGLSILILFPKTFSTSKRINSFLSPTWDIRHILLGLFCINLMLLFPISISLLKTDLITPILFAFITTAVGIVLHIYICYSNNRSKPVMCAFLLSRFLAPLGIANIYAYVLNGSYENIFGSINILLYAVVILSIILISSSFFRYIEREKVQRKAIDTMIHESFVFLLLFILCIPVIILKFIPYLLLSPIKDLTSIAVLILSIGIFNYFAYIKNYFGQFLGAGLIVGTIFYSLLIMHLSYFTYPNTTIFSEFVQINSSMQMEYILLTAILSIMGSLVLLYKLFQFGRKK